MLFLPCLQGDGVQGLIAFFFLGVPGLLAIVAAWPASKSPINAKNHAEIQVRRNCETLKMSRVRISKALCPWG